jgi:hypothetical protein
MFLNPFTSKVSANNLALTFEDKSALQPVETTCLPTKIKALRNQADGLEAKLNTDLAKIWAFFGGDRQEAYYQKKMLSYSFLKHVDAIRYPKPQYGDKQRNFALGRAFEDMLTDCLDVSLFPNLETSDFIALQKMCEYAKQDAWISDYLTNYQTQVEREGVVKGYKVKGKLDFLNTEVGIGADLKSTSAKTLNGFLKACYDFGYYTQGYIYQQIEPEIKDYIISGVCKSYPAVYSVPMTPADFQAGERELDRLLENLNYYGLDAHFKA